MRLILALCLLFPVMAYADVELDWNWVMPTSRTDGELLKEGELTRTLVKEYTLSGNEVHAVKLPVTTLKLTRQDGYVGAFEFVAVDSDGQEGQPTPIRRVQDKGDEDVIIIKAPPGFITAEVKLKRTAP
jgi:hypothetical protein